MALQAIGVVIGVANPDAFKLSNGKTVDLPAIAVADDVGWYAQTLRDSFSAIDGDWTVKTLVSREETKRDVITKCLEDLRTQLDPRGLFVLILSGHGFQDVDTNGDEAASPVPGDGPLDVQDEFYCAADHPIRDDVFGELWKKLLTTQRLISIADTCSSDTVSAELIRRSELNVQPVLPREGSGAPKIFISSAMSWEKAVESEFGSRVYGVMTEALKSAWGSKPASYLEWFTLANKKVRECYPDQHPRLRYYADPDQELLNAQPFAP